MKNYNPYDIQIIIDIDQDGDSEKENEIEIIDLNLSSTSVTNRDNSDEEEDEEEMVSIHLPEKVHFNRQPGSYDDLKSKFKKKHNNLILRHSKFLDDKIVALILDGKKMRTTRTLYS